MSDPLYPRHSNLEDSEDETIDALKASLAIATEENARLRDELEAEKVRRETAEARLEQITKVLQRRASV